MSLAVVMGGFEMYYYVFDFRIWNEKGYVLR